MSEPRPDHILQVGTASGPPRPCSAPSNSSSSPNSPNTPKPSTELSARLGLHPRSARDFLDALVALNFLERRDGIYYNTPSTDLFLDKRKPSYIGGMLEMANNRLYPHWGHLTTALRTGEPQNEARGGGDSPFVALYADPERLRGFLKSHDRRQPRSQHRHREAVPLGRTTNPPSTSAPHKAISSPRSRSPIRTSPASASIFPTSAPSSRTTSPPTASPAASSSTPAASSTHPSPPPTSS